MRRRSMDLRVIRSHLKVFDKTLQNKEVCIGSHVSNMDVGLCVVKSEPPVWFCDVAGQRRAND